MISRDLQYVLRLAQPYRGALLATAALSVATSALLLGVPWLAGRLAARISADEAVAMKPILLVMLVLFAGLALLQFAHNWLTTRTGEDIYADLRRRVYDHLQSLPMPFFDARPQGEVLSLLMVDVATLGRFLSGTLVGVGPMLLTFIGALAIMFALAPMLALLAALVVPVFAIMIRFLARSVRPLSKAVRDEEIAAHAIAEDNLGMLETVKAFTREPTESIRYAEQIDASLQLRAQRRRITAALAPATYFFVAVAIIVTLWLAAPMLSAGTLGPGELVSFLLYAVLLTRPLTAMAGMYGNVQTTRGALSRLLEVLDETPESLDDAGQQLTVSAGAIEFQGVGFAYANGKTVLDDFNLDVAAGETVAIIGRNGAGKTTLIKLLLRFQETTAGKILIDGCDIAGISRSSLRNHIGLVPQQVLLFDGSIAANIAYAKPQASEADIEAAARTACAHEFISQLPQAYATRVGSRGVRLSGGQRQRIALARALLLNPPILVLDEGTAMLDPEGEADFLSQAKAAFAHRTVILVTHQPASLKLADRVIRLEAGQTHDATPALQALPTGQTG